MRNNISNLLTKRGLSIRKMSIDLGMDYSATHKLVNREDLGTTQLITVINVAEYLGVSIEELYKIKGAVEMREEIKGLDVKYERIIEKLNTAKADGNMSALYNLRTAFDESFDEFFDDEDLRRKYGGWDEEEQQPLFNETNTSLLEMLDDEDLEDYIDFYEELIEQTEDELNELTREMFDPFEFEEVQILEKALRLINENSHTGSAGERAYSCLNELTDDIEEFGVVNRELLANAKKAAIDSARYAGYTNIQHDLIAEVREILDVI